MRKILIVFFCLIALTAFAENVLFKYTGSKDPALIVPENVKVIKIGDSVYLSGEKEMIESIFDNSTVKEINPPERKLKYTPNDEFYNNQWSLHNTADTDIDWPEAMDIFIESQETPIVVVMDSGIAWNHPDLESNLLTGGDYGNYGFEFCDNESITNYDKIGHGTHIAGIIGAVTDNTFGVAGVSNNNIKILNMKVTCGSDKIDFTAELKAISKILDLKESGHNIKFVNMSFGGNTFENEEQTAIQQLVDSGIHVFAAAGNDNETAKDYPAGYENVIAVGATDKNNGLSQYSNYGDWVDIYAPGESIFSTYAEYLAKPDSLNLLDKYKDAFRDEFEGNNSLTTFNGGWSLDGSGHAKIILPSESACSDNATNSISMGPFDSNLPDYRYKNIIISMKASSGSRIFVDWSTESQNWTNLLTQSGLNNMDYIYGITDIPAASQNFSLRICLEGSVGSQASIDAVRVSASSSPDAFAYEYGTSMATPFVTAAAALGYIDKGQFSKYDLITNAESINTSVGELKKLNLYNYLEAEFVADNGTSQDDTTANSENDGGGGGGGCSIAGTSGNNNILFLLAVVAGLFWVRKKISPKERNN